MTPPDWASQRVAKVLCTLCPRDGMHDVVHDVEAARLLRLEHEKDVRAVMRLERDMQIFDKSCDFKRGYVHALMDVLTALQRGRTQKGTR